MKVITNTETVNTANTSVNVNRKLSKQQLDVLAYIFRFCRAREDYHVSKDEGWDPAYQVGFSGWAGGGGCYPSIPWSASHYLRRNPSRSESASLSRCLSRLLERNLIEYPKGSGYAQEITLTQEGRRIASLHAGEIDRYPTEEDYQCAYYPGMTIEAIREMREQERSAFRARNVKESSDV